VRYKSAKVQNVPLPVHFHGVEPIYGFVIMHNKFQHPKGFDHLAPAIEQANIVNLKKNPNNLVRNLIIKL
jgi:hypothetical protein